MENIGKDNCTEHLITGHDIGGKAQEAALVFPELGEHEVVLDEMREAREDERALQVMRQEVIVLATAAEDAGEHGAGETVGGGD